MVDNNFKRLTDFFIGFGADDVRHTNKSYLAHVIGVYRDMESGGCTMEVCRAGMFHSIYGTERFQRFALPLARRPEVRGLIGERAEQLAYVNCAMDRDSFDRALERNERPYRILDRLSGEEITLGEEDFGDLCRVHLYDWLEQVPRSREWNYRRAAYQHMANRLGGAAREAYGRIFAELEQSMVRAATVKEQASETAP